MKCLNSNKECNCNYIVCNNLNPKPNIMFSEQHKSYIEELYEDNDTDWLIEQKNLAEWILMSLKEQIKEATWEEAYECAIRVDFCQQVLRIIDDKLLLLNNNLKK